MSWKVRWCWLHSITEFGRMRKIEAEMIAELDHKLVP